MMSDCILCLSKIAKKRIVKLNEKINDTMTLSEAIREHLACGSSILSQKASDQQSACYYCFKSFKTFYEFLTKITHKHPQFVKTEKLEKPSLTIVNINDERPIEFQELSNVKVEAEIPYDNASDGFNDNDGNRFDDSDFEWNAEEGNEPKVMFDTKKEENVESIEVKPDLATVDVTKNKRRPKKSFNDRFKDSDFEWSMDEEEFETVDQKETIVSTESDLKPVVFAENTKRTRGRPKKQSNTSKSDDLEPEIKIDEQAIKIEQKATTTSSEKKQKPAAVRVANKNKVKPKKPPKKPKKFGESDDDSGSDWSMNEELVKIEESDSEDSEESAPAIKRIKTNPSSDIEESVAETIPKMTRKTRRTATTSPEVDTSLIKNENGENQPKQTTTNENLQKLYSGPILKKAITDTGYVRYLPHSQVTQEIIDSGLKFVVIGGVEYKVPKKIPKKKVDVLEQLESRLRRGDPNRRAHPSLDPEGEEKIRRFMDIKCYICSETFDSFFRLKKHFKLFHPKKLAYLVCCDRKFKRRFELLDHIEFHDKSVVYRCEDCNKVYKSKYCLKMHRKHMHEEPRTGEMCTICGGIFSSSGALKGHMLVHISDHRIFECYKCKGKRTYKNEFLLKKHMDSRHNYLKPNNVTVCHICSSTFKESYLPRHMDLVHGEEYRERVQCKICGFWLLKQTMKVHMLKHNDQGVTCSECGKFLKSKYSLTGHMKQAHSTDYKFYCQFCQKGFHKENKMIEHVAVRHTRDFPFKCRVESCGKGFRAEGNWRIHEKKAHPEEYELFFKPFYLKNPNETIVEGFQ